jgi:hypothetical protein
MKRILKYLDKLSDAKVVRLLTLIISICNLVLALIIFLMI